MHIPGPNGGGSDGAGGRRHEDWAQARQFYPGAKGSAQYKAKAGQRELEMEVEHIRRLAGRQVVILVADTKVGTAKVSALGAAQISRSTERGQRVPRVAAGTSVKVRTARGTGIVSGSF